MKQPPGKRMKPGLRSLILPARSARSLDLPQASDGMREANPSHASPVVVRSSSALVFAAGLNVRLYCFQEFVSVPMDWV